MKKETEETIKREYFNYLLGIYNAKNGTKKMRLTAEENKEVVNNFNVGQKILAERLKKKYINIKNKKLELNNEPLREAGLI